MPKRASAINWDGVESDYRSSPLSVRRIALTYGCTEGAVRKRAKDRGWVRGEPIPEIDELPSGAQVVPIGDAFPEDGEYASSPDESTQSRPVGRPTAYRPEFADDARKICETWAATDTELADYFGISIPTFYAWQVKHPEFLKAVALGKDAPDNRVEKSVFHKSVGYSVDAEKVFLYKGKPVRVRYREHFPPDTGAAALWLKNRRPQLWRDRQDVSVKVEDNRSPEELRLDILRDVLSLGLLPQEVLEHLPAGFLDPPIEHEPQGIANRDTENEGGQDEGGQS